jgi:hypothetical protein
MESIFYQTELQTVKAATHGGQGLKITILKA